MQDPANRPLLADLRAELGALGDELRETAAARLELARLELQSDLRSAKRLAAGWLASAAMALTALPLLAASLAEALDGCCGIARCGWLLILACGLLLAAIIGGRLVWNRFRRRFVGLQETLEELREDVLWLREKGEGGRRRAEGGRGKVEGG